MITDLSKKINELIDEETWDKKDFEDVNRILELLWERWNDISKQVDDFALKIKEINDTRYAILPEKLYEELLYSPRTFSLKKYENYLKSFEGTTREKLKNEFSFLHKLFLLVRENILPVGEFPKKAFEQLHGSYESEVSTLKDKVNDLEENEEKLKKTKFFKMLSGLVRELEDVRHLMSEEEGIIEEPPKPQDKENTEDKTKDIKQEEEEEPRTNREKIIKLLENEPNLTAKEISEKLKIDLEVTRTTLSRMITLNDINGVRKFGREAVYHLK